MRCGAQLAAGAEINSRPTLRDGSPAGGRGGRGASEARYVHTPLATSSRRTYRGDTKTGERMYRARVRRETQARVVDSLNNGGEIAEAKRLACCGQWFNLGRCPDGGTRLEPHPCNSIFCAECADRKSRALAKRILPACRKAGKRYYFLTLTISNTSDLTREMLDRLIGCFARLRRSRVWQEVRTLDGRTGSVSGGLYAVECVYNRVRDDWHPHIHSIIETPGRNSPEWLAELKAEWTRITDGATYLNLTPVYRLSKRGKRVTRKVNKGALREVVKYVTKSADFARSPERVCEFLRAFKHVRRVQCFGSFVGLLGDPEREPGDDGTELQCSCGNSHTHSQFEWSSRPVHVSETIVGAHGVRQLKWDFWLEIAGSVEERRPALELVAPRPVNAVQVPLEFSGAMPEESESSLSLFTDAA